MSFYNKLTESCSYGGPLPTAITAKDLMLLATAETPLISTHELKKLLGATGPSPLHVSVTAHEVWELQRKGLLTTEEARKVLGL